MRAAFRACAGDRPLDGDGVRGRAQNNTERVGACAGYEALRSLNQGESPGGPGEDRQLEGLEGC